MTDHATATELDVRSRATKVAQIFDLLAMVVLGIGALAAVVWVVAAVVTIAGGDSGFFVLLVIVGYS